MKCPRCSVLLNEITKAGVLVDVCDRCLGIWLDRGEMEKIAARLRQVEREWDDDRLPPADVGDVRHASAEHDRYRKKKRWSDLFDIFD